MTNRPNLFQDVSRLAGDAASALGTVKAEVETVVKQRLEHLLEDCDLVRREEFEAVQAMAAAAREEQDKLNARVAELEARIDGLLQASQTATPKAAAKKPATRKPKASKPSAQPESPAENQD